MIVLLKRVIHLYLAQYSLVLDKLYVLKYYYMMHVNIHELSLIIQIARLPEIFLQIYPPGRTKTNPLIFE